MAGPSFSRMAEMMLADLPQRLGPMTAIAERSPARPPGRARCGRVAQLVGHQAPPDTSEDEPARAWGP